MAGQAPPARAGYLFHGEELFPAHEAVEDLKRRIEKADGQPPIEERYDLEETPWRDIVDAARTVPLMFIPWRLFLITAPGAKAEDLAEAEAGVLKEFFASPVPRTTLIVFFQGKIRKTMPLYKIFASAAEEEIREFKPVKGRTLDAWAREKAESLGKTIAADALDRLIEISGNDMRRLDGELEKLACFVGARPAIARADVDAVSDWVRSFDEWELTASLEKADVRRAILILHRLMDEGGKPELLMGHLAGFFRNIFLAQAALQDGGDKREIFKALYPQIKEEWRGLFNEKLDAFFGIVDKLGRRELAGLLDALETVDARIKTSDSEARSLLEAFFHQYRRAVRGAGFTSQRSNSGPRPGG